MSLSMTSLSRQNTRPKKKRKKRPKRERSQELTVTVLGCHKNTIEIPKTQKITRKIQTLTRRRRNNNWAQLGLVGFT
jgi:hypothetical protein